MADLSPETEALMLAYVYGELSESAAEAFEAQLAGDPDLRAEVDGLVATRELLNEDVRYGEQSGLDAPPPHLQEAIFRAEALARPAEVRQAALQRSAPVEQAPPLLHRLSTWLLGGGLALGAAAAALFVVSSSTLQAPASEVAAPSAESAAAHPSSAVGFDDDSALDKRAPADRADGDGALETRAAPGGPGMADDAKALAFDTADAEEGKAAQADPGQGRGARLGGLNKKDMAAGSGGAAQAPSRSAPRDDLDAPAMVTAGRKAEGAAANEMEVRLYDKAKADEREPAADRGLAEADSALPEPEEAPRASSGAKKARSVRRSAKPSPKGSADEFSAAPPPVPSSMARMQRERLQERKRSPARAKSKMASPGSQLNADLNTNAAMQAADDAMKRGRYREAASLYREAMAGRSANSSVLILSRYVEAAVRAGQDAQALAAFKKLERLTRKQPIEGDLRNAYIFAGKAAERTGQKQRAAALYKKAKFTPTAKSADAPQ